MEDFMEEFEILDKNGEYTGEVASREECHKKGYLHKAVAMFIMNSNNEILIQQRSGNKKLWPNKWDITAGGHVLNGEFGFQAIIRETKEEIGIDVDTSDLIFIGSSFSENIMGDVINRHLNEFYIVKSDLLIDNIVLQQEEVQAIKWISKDELLELINNKSEDLTDKWNCWNYLKKYLESLK